MDRMWDVYRCQWGAGLHMQNLQRSCCPAVPLALTSRVLWTDCCLLPGIYMSCGVRADLWETTAVGSMLIACKLHQEEMDDRTSCVSCTAAGQSNCLLLMSFWSCSMALEAHVHACIFPGLFPGVSFCRIAVQGAPQDRQEGCELLSVAQLLMRPGGRHVLQGEMWLGFLDRISFPCCCSQNYFTDCQVRPEVTSV